MRRAPGRALAATVTLTGVTTGSVPTERVRRLNAAEIDSYDVLPADLAARVRIVKVPVMPGRYLGMTLGRTVLLRRHEPDDGWSRLIAHELTHVRQWTELGLFGFGARYLGNFVKGLVGTRSWNKAYRQIALEQEARDITEEWQRRRNTRPRTDT